VLTALRQNSRYALGGISLPHVQRQSTLVSGLRELREYVREGGERLFDELSAMRLISPFLEVKMAVNKAHFCEYIRKNHFFLAVPRWCAVRRPVGM
jgi:hypothetical protein